MQLYTEEFSYILTYCSTPKHESIIDNSPIRWVNVMSIQFLEILQNEKSFEFVAENLQSPWLDDL